MKISNVPKTFLFFLFILTIQSCKAPVRPMTCDISLTSPVGGRVEVERIDPTSKLSFSDRLQILWHPPTSSPTIDLVVAYGNTSGTPGPIQGGHFQFVPPLGVTSDHYEAVLDIQGDKEIRFDKSEIELGADQGDIVFLSDTPKGQKIISAINTKKIIKIFILNGDKTVSSGTFDTTVTDSRDSVLKMALHFSEISDPKYCKAL